MSLLTIGSSHAAATTVPLVTVGMCELPGPGRSPDLWEQAHLWYPQSANPELSSTVDGEG